MAFLISRETREWVELMRTREIDTINTLISSDRYTMCHLVSYNRAQKEATIIGLTPERSVVEFKEQLNLVAHTQEEYDTLLEDHLQGLLGVHSNFVESQE